MMDKPRALSALLVAVVLLAATNWTATHTVSADAPGPPEIVVFVADAAAVRQFEQNPNLVSSFIGLVAALQKDRPVMFIGADDPLSVIGPSAVGDPDFNTTHDEIHARLRSPSSQNVDGPIEALARAQTALARKMAAPSSEVYLITGSYPGVNFERLSRLTSTLAGQFANNGWPINGVGLPGASADAMAFLNGISTKTGGRVFELSIPDGFKNLTDAILREEALGSLREVGGQVLTFGELLTSVINVAPGTRETTILLFKESPYGSLRLSNPSGFEASSGDRTASSVMEMPNVVIWSITDPMPGAWKIDVRGLEGHISAWEHSSNKYSLVLQSREPLPLNEPNHLVAYVEEAGQVAALKGVRLLANVTTPEGITLSYELNDDGMKGDAKSGDGYFSATLPPLRVEGEYKVELLLSWLDNTHLISSQTTFQSQAYPAIEVRPVELGDLKPGERTKVATVITHVLGESYPVAPELLTASLASPAGQDGVLELHPQRLFGEGPAWEYDVYLTAQDPGLYTQTIRLSLEYAGRMYSYSTDSLVLSVVAPSASMEQVVEPAPVAPVAQSLTRPSLETESSSLPWPVVAVLVMMLAAVAAIAVYLLTRARPHGFLYDDMDKPLVNFAKVRRNPIRALLFGGSVRGRELNVPGLEGVVFRFSRKGISLHRRRGYPTVRVNNQPLIGQAPIQDSTWIGTTGRLYTFMLSPNPAHGGASAD